MARIQLADGPQVRPVALPADDEVDLREVAAALWAGRWLVAAITAVALLAAVLFLHLATYRYTATLTLAPTQSGGFGNAARMSGLGSVASLAGVSLPQDSSELDFTLFTEGVHSRQLADRLARRPELMHQLFAAQWDADAKQWRQPASALASIIRPLKRVLGIPVYPWAPPDGAQLQEFLQHAVKVQTNTDNPFITLSFDSKDPALTTTLLNDLAQDLNEILREKALRRATDNIDYLSKLVDRVTIVEHRLAIIQALGEQERKRMLANSGTPYAADPVGAASVSMRPTSPKPMVILVFALAGGLVLGVIVVLLRNSFRNMVQSADDLAQAEAEPLASGPGEAPARSAGR